MRLLPLPRVSFANVTVGRYADGTPMMTVESFSMDCELMPFLSGEIKIVDMQLERPHAVIRVSQSGMIDWTNRKQTMIDPDKVEVESLTVSNGSFDIEGLAGGRRIVGENFGVRTAALALSGPWRMQAHGDLDGVATELAVSTGHLQDNNELRLSIEARRIDQPYKLGLDGPVRLSQGVLEWAGKFTLTPATDADGNRDPLSLPARASGQFLAAPNAVEIAEYRLDIGEGDEPYTITGKARATIGSELAFRVEADGRRIDIDTISKSGASGPASLDARLAVLQQIINLVPVPSINGEIDFELPAIVAGDTVVREVRALLKPESDGWEISRLSAMLPGNTTVEAQGRLGKGDDYGFSGRLLLASRQPTGFANWLSGSSDAALRRLKSAGFSADVNFSPGQASFDNLELVLDGVAITGVLKRLKPATGRPAMFADIAGTAIDLDDLRAIQALAQQKNGESFAGHDLDIALKAGVLRADGLVARDVDAHLQVQNGLVSVDRLNIGDFHGARIESSGKLTDLFNRADGNFSLTVKAADGSALVALARQRLGENRFLDALLADSDLLRDVDLKLEMQARPQGDGTKGTASVTGAVGGTQLDISDGFEGQLAKWAEARHKLSAKLVQQSPQILARQLSLEALPLAVAGPAVLDLELSGNALAGFDTQFSLQAPGTDFAANGRVGFAAIAPQDHAASRLNNQQAENLIEDNDQEPAIADKPASALLRQVPASPDFAKPAFEMALTFGAKDIEPWLLLFGQSLPATGEGTPLSLVTTAKQQGDMLRFENLSGQIAGNGFSGTLVIDHRGPGSGGAKLTGSLAADVLSLPVLGELVTGSGTFGTHSFDNALPQTQFGEPPMAGMVAAVDFKARILASGTSVEASDFSGKIELSDVSLSIPQFTCGLLGGSFAGALSLKRSSGDGALHLQGNLADADIDALLGAIGQEAVLAGKTDITISLDANGRTVSALAGDVSGSGTLSLRDAWLNGVWLNGLGNLLAEADADGFVINAAALVPLAEKQILHSQTALGNFDGTFSLTKGKAVVRNLVAKLPAGRLQAEASLDVPTGETSALLSVVMDPGKEAVAGAEPEASFLFKGTTGRMSRTTDVAALEGYLSLRRYEMEQRRVAILEASVLEKQRLRREVSASKARQAIREQKRQLELQRLEELQRKLEAERATREETAQKAALAEAERQNRAIKAEAQKLESLAQPAITPKAALPQPRPHDASTIGEGLQAPLESPEPPPAKIFKPLHTPYKREN